MKLRMLASLVLIVGLGTLAAGCGGGESFGEQLSTGATTPIAEVLADPASFEGQAVKIEGTIVRECPSGCWFELEDGSAVIHVDIAPHGLAIPQKVGATATVEGTVQARDGRTMLVGSGVVIR
jgi:hypothetical protein